MGKADHNNYGVVLDAGSSGTRVYVYKWKKNSEAREDADQTELKSLPELKSKEKWNMKVHPGVSTFGEKPEQIWDDHLKELMEHALKYIPAKAVKDTPVFVLATAGMRLLPDDQRNTLLAKMCSSIRSNTDFYLPDCDLHVQVIPGDTEGLYGWIAANYLLGGFNAPEEHDHGKGHHTYGFLDMGGASAQIAFAPNATEADKHANDLKLVRFRSIDGTVQEHRVFVTTWLGFGVNQARKRYVQALIESFAGEDLKEMPDPCLPNGVILSEDGKLIDLDNDYGGGSYLIGTGKFDECLKRTFPLLEKEKECVDEPCLINGVHVPGIDFDVNHFIGISEYWHTTHEIFEKDHKDKAYDFNTYQHRVKDFCEQNWSEIADGVAHQQWGKKVSAQTAYEVCFKASWLINVLHDGIGVPRVGIEGTSGSHNGTKEVIDAGKEKGFLDAFQAVNKIKDVEISWTMGKMLLYASADVPAISAEDGPVGFGSNEVGVTVPSDFQYPGGGGLQDTADTSHQSLTDKLSSSLFDSESSHRLPGFLLFLLIMVIAIFYLCGRERRARIYTTYLSGKSGKQSPTRGLLGRLLGHTPRSTDRMRDLEDGSATRLYDPSEFELGDLNDSDDDLDDLKTGPGHDLASGAKKLALKGNRLGRRSPDHLIDRNGLVVRTESRENLGDIGGRKSRSGSMSPTRLRNGQSS